MAETNKSKLMSEAEIIEAINSDSLVSVSLGAGQPQKNVKLSTLASVVAGLMGFNSSFLGYVGAIGDYGTYKDVDNLPKNGYYDIKGTSNITGTVPFQSYGMLLNISGIGTSGYGFQLLLANNSTSTGTRIAMRVRINNTWIGWTTLS